MAYKIYICEDEHPILRDIIQKIESLGQGFQIIGHATNGEDAYEEIVRLNPDLIITDIRMPVMDGLTLIHKIKSDFPEMICLILSGYKDFDYARQALKLGVDDFIVKPLSKDQLSESLHMAKLRMDEIHKGKIHALLHSMIRFENAEADLSVLPFQHFELLYLCLNNPINRAPESTVYHKEVSARWESVDIEKALQYTDKASSKVWILDIGYENEKLIVVASLEPFALEKEAVWAYLHQFSQSNPCYFTVTYGSCAINAKAFIGEAEACRKATRNRAILGLNQMFDLKSGIDEKHKEWMINASDEHMLSILCRNNQHRTFVESMRRFMGDWESRGIPCVMLEANLTNVLKIADRNSNLVEHLHEDTTESFIESLFLANNTWTSLNQMFFTKVDRLFSARIEMNKTDYSHIVHSVCEYMDNHYASKMSLREISEQFEMSESQLCKLFKKHKSESPIDYLIRVRIEKAKQIMDKHDALMIKEIGEMVGFTGQHYFSRMFRNFTGVSPSEYKDPS